MSFVLPTAKTLPPRKPGTMARPDQSEGMPRGLASIVMEGLLAQVTPSMPLPLRIMAMILAVCLLILAGLVPIQVHRSLNADAGQATSRVFNRARLVASEAARRLDQAETGLKIAARLAGSRNDAISALDAGRSLSGASLLSLSLIGQDGTLIGISGTDNRDMIIKAAQAGRLGRPDAPALDLMALKSRLKETADVYMILSQGPGSPLVVGRVANSLSNLDNGREDVAALVDEHGMVIMASDNQLAGQSLQGALGVTLNSLRDAAADTQTVEGSRSELGIYRLGAVHDESHQVWLVFGQPGRGAAQPLSDLIVGLAYVIGPLVIGTLFAALLWVQARRTAQQADQFQESELRYRMAVESAHCGIWEWDLQEDLVYMSDVTGAMFGWGGGGVARGSEIIARIDPANRELMLNALENGRLKGAIDVSIAIPNASRPLWIDMRGQATGPHTQAGFIRLSGVALDVSEERIAQLRAQRAEIRLVDAINSVSDAFVLWDRRGQLVMWNRTFGRTFALEPQLLKVGAARQPIEQLVDISIRRSLPSPDGREGVFEAELNDGRWIQVSESRTKEGGRVLTYADITAIKNQEEMRRRNEDELKAMVDKLEQAHKQQAVLAKKYEMAKVRAESANHAKSEFLANMSHELRTPLNAINGFSEIMAGEMFGPLGHARYKEYAGDILGSGQHLLALINDILDMSKIEAGKMTLRIEPLDVPEAIDDTVRLVRQRAEKAGLRLKVHLPSQLPELQADARALKQILLNLLTNAIKFTPSGGQVSLSVTPTDQHLHFQVQDTGIGIDRKDMDRLARPFEQIENQMSKTKEGTGLGLALTKSLIEMHGGRLEVDSELGKGTLVTVILPLTQTRKLIDADSLSHAPSDDSVSLRQHSPSDMSVA